MLKTLILLFVSFLFSHAQVGIDFSNDPDIDKAIARAKAENKFIFVDTYTRYCQACKKLDREFKDPELSTYFNNNFINVKVNMLRQVADKLQERYQVVFLPTMLFLSADGKLKHSIDKYIPANELLAIGKSMFRKPGVIASNTKASKPKPKPKKPLASAAIIKNEKPKVIAQPKLNQDLAINPSTQVQKQKEVEKSTITKADIIQNEEEGKILYVMGSDSNDLPPEVLWQEAYFRMQLMNGSHKEAAKKYMATQKDWLEEKNIRFLHDFLEDARSDEFHFMMDNLKAFKSTLGEKKIQRTINILTEKELRRAFPRPNQTRATLLYKYQNLPNPERLGLEYDLNKLYENGETEKFLTEASSHNELQFSEDHLLIYRYTSEFIQKESSKRKLKKITDLTERTITLKPDISIYWLNLANLYYKLGESKKVREAVTEARNRPHSSELAKVLDKLINELDKS